MSRKEPKSDPPSIKLDVPFAKEIAALGFDAFDDPDEITSTTARALNTIREDQKHDDDDDSNTFIALLSVMTKMRREQKAAHRAIKLVVFSCALIFAVIFALDKAGIIQFVHH